MTMTLTRGLSDSMIIAVFVVAIVTPGLVMLFGEAETISNREKRRLQSKPELDVSMLLDGSYQKQFDRYFQDQFGLRNAIHERARQVRETMFRKSISDNVILGEEGWRFFDIDGSLQDFTGGYQPSPEQLDQWARALGTRIDWLQSLGVRYVLVPIPGKMTMYPQHLPDRLRMLAGVTRLDAFRAWIGSPERNATAVRHVVDARAALERRIDADQLFFKTDTHWNDLGAFLVYKETMKTIRQWLPDIPVVAESRLVRVPKSKEGDIARASGLPADYTEETFALELKGRCAGSTYRRIDSFAATTAFQARKKKLPVANGCPGMKYRAIVIHDSFGQFLKQFMDESFAEVVYMPSYDWIGMRDFIKDFAPDVLIDFRVERRFHLLLKEDKRMTTQLGEK